MQHYTLQYAGQSTKHKATTAKRGEPPAFQSREDHRQRCVDASHAGPSTYRHKRMANTIEQFPKNKINQIKKNEQILESRDVGPPTMKDR